jgi:hypothetical protein
VALVWRPQESLPSEEPMSSLPPETQRLHQKPERPSWRQTQQLILMFWSLTLAPSSLSGLLPTSSSRWIFLWMLWCNHLRIFVHIRFFNFEIALVLVKFLFSLGYITYKSILVLFSCLSLLNQVLESFLFCRNNAGVMFCPFQLSEDGVEMQFATNHLGMPALSTCVTLLKSLPGTDSCLIRAFSAYQPPPW